MHVLVTGGTGFIGSALLPALRKEGHQLTVLTRQARGGEEGLQYIQSLDEIASDTVIGAVVNLAGASLAGARWTARYKREIVNSRLDTTQALVDMMARLASPPDVFLSASAIGYYGHHGDERLDETGSSVAGFSQGLCAQWEALAMKAELDLGVRTCIMRLGVVLDASGGAFQQMAQPFKMGVGNWVGDGRQWLSWVHLLDVVRAIQFLLEDTSLSGAFNLTAPEPVTSKGFCRAMQSHYRTLVRIPMPAAVMKLALGEMAQELLISGQRVLPAHLEQAGFQFQYPVLDEALAKIKSA